MIISVEIAGIALALVTEQTGSIWSSVIIHCLYNILSGESQILHVLQYKSSLYWGYISTYVAFVPFLAWFIIYATLVRGCIIVGIVLLLVILDIFVFRHLYRKVGQLLEANKELRRLEDMIQNN